MPSYQMNPSFERGATVLCLTKPLVWKRVGRFVDPASLPTQEAAKAFALGRDVAGESGVPGGISIVLQAALGEMEDGELSPDDYKALVIYLEDALDDFLDGEWNPTALEKQLARQVQRHERDAGAEAVVDAWAKGNSDKIAEGLERVRGSTKIGEDADSGTEVRSLSERIAEIKARGKVELLPYGYVEVDALCDGGRNRGCVSLVGGGTGDGKSICISSSVAYAVSRGLFCAIASTELRPHLVSARVDAAMFGIGIDQVRDDPDCLLELYEEFEEYIGPLALKQFEPAPGVHTRVSDVRDWVKRIEDSQGRALELLALDPIDRLKPSVAKFKGSGYSAGEHVMDELCQWAAEDNLWIDGSSHTVRRKTGAYWTENDFSDSQHKARRADTILTVNASGPKGARMMAINFCKDREGSARGIIGPLPAMFAYGRLMPMTIFDQDNPYDGL